MLNLYISYHIISYHWFYLAATLPRHGRETRPSSQPPRLRPLNPDCSRKRTAGFCTLMRWRWALVTQRLRGEFWVGTRLLPWKKTRFLQRDGAPIMEVSMGKSSIYIYVYIYTDTTQVLCVYIVLPHDSWGYPSDSERNNQANLACTELTCCQLHTFDQMCPETIPCCRQKFYLRHPKCGPPC